VGVTLPDTVVGAPTIDRAVVKVISVAAGPSYEQPWQTGPQNLQSGSGAVISPGMVLTNAHVVANQTFVQVQRQGDPKKYPAEVVAAGHECDLALLKVTDPNFNKGVKPLGVGKMPGVRDKVAAYGFPIGGDKLSITEGVVSRIEMGQYSHCWKTLPLVQIDAAINPGSSGGPVIKGGKIAGIAFQGMGQAENVGYMIPPPVISHFLEDVKDGAYDGFPSLGIHFQPLENPSHRKSLGMRDEQNGVLITRVAYESSAWGKLSPGDVILEVEGQELANDGTVPFVGGERIMFAFFLVDKFIGDAADMKILRDGREESVILPLKSSRSIISTCEFDVMPSYYLWGGLVFSALSLNYLQTWDVKWWYASPVELRYHLFNDISTPERQQVVILQYVLADEVNVGYHDVRDQVAARVNGEDVADLKDLVQRIEGTDREFIEIETEAGEKIVLFAAEARAANPRIMERYRIPADRSEDLKD
jgi:S1-C subfamily serine protease